MLTSKISRITALAALLACNSGPTNQCPEPTAGNSIISSTLPPITCNGTCASVRDGSPQICVTDCTQGGETVCDALDSGFQCFPALTSTSYCLPPCDADGGCPSFGSFELTCNVDGGFCY